MEFVPLPDEGKDLKGLHFLLWESSTATHSPTNEKTNSETLEDPNWVIYRRLGAWARRRSSRCIVSTV